MLAKTQLVKASWTLADQAVVSLGVFLANVLLARHLMPADYGTFALIYGILLTLQLVPSSLIYYPLSVRRIVAEPQERRQLMGTGFVFTVLACVPLVGIVGAVLAALGRTDLIAPVFFYLCSWQLQEVARRGLLGEFRYKGAIPGDVISYLGQVAAILALIASGTLTLSNAIYVMGFTSAIAALIQSIQVGAVLPKRPQMLACAVDFWSIGSWSLANNLVATLRIQIFPWVLTILYGPAAVAPFQAALNVANVANPVVIGLCNVIPQTAAQALSRGKLQAWKAAKPFVLIGVPPTLLYCVLAFIAPSFVLEIMYGAGSPYLDTTTLVRLLIFAWMVSYAADMVCSYLHGVDGAKLAFQINVAGAIGAIILSVPMTLAFGLVGACAALAGVSVLRVVFSQLLFARIFADERPQPA